jgi:hypothetical protein
LWSDNIRFRNLRHQIDFSLLANYTDVLNRALIDSLRSIKAFWQLTGQPGIEGTVTRPARKDARLQ